MNYLRDEKYRQQRSNHKGENLKKDLLFSFSANKYPDPAFNPPPGQVDAPII